MAISALVVTGPAGTGLPLVLGGIGQITVAWGVAAPAGQGCLPYMQAAKFKVFVGTDTVFAHASLAATVPNGPVTLAISGSAISRNVWVVAVDPLGFESAPAGPVSVTTKPTPASADDLDDLALEFDATIDDLETEFHDANTAIAARTSILEATANNPTTGVAALNAKITNEQTARIDGDNVINTSLTTLTTKFNNTTLSGRVGWRQTATAAGFTNSFEIFGQNTVGGSSISGGAKLDLTASDSRWRFSASRFLFETAAGATIATFDANGIVLRGRLSAESVDTPTLFVGGLGLDTGLIKDFAVIRPGIYSNNAGIDVEAGLGNVEVANVGVATNGGRVEVTFTASLYALLNGSNNWGTFIARLYRGGATQVAECVARPDDEGQDAVVILHYIDQAPAANSTWTVGVQYISGSPGPGVAIGCKNRFLSAQNLKK